MEDFRKPFPALSPVQRLHFEVYGYVVIENTLSKERIATLLDKIYEIENIFRTTGEYPYGLVANAYSSAGPDYFRIDNLPHIDKSFFDYLTDPYLVGLAQEIVGTHVRLLQSDAHIVRYPPEKIEQQQHGFHGGWHGERSVPLPIHQNAHQSDGPGRGRRRHGCYCRKSQAGWHRKTGHHRCGVAGPGEADTSRRRSGGIDAPGVRIPLALRGNMRLGQGARLYSRRLRAVNIPASPGV